MKALADYVHSKGLKIGLYSSPGPKTCAGYEGSYGHEEQDANTYAAWGFDYLKYDWCSAGDIYKPQDMRAVYQKMGDALQATGRPIVFSLCQYGIGRCLEVGSRRWAAIFGAPPATSTIDGRAWMKSASSNSRSLPISRPGHWNDPDMLEIGNGGMTADEYRTHMSLWSLLAAPLLAGNDLRTMSEETKSILMNKEVIAIDQDPEAQPVKKISEQGALVVAARPLKDKTWAVGLFNRGDARGKDERRLVGPRASRQAEGPRPVGAQGPGQSRGSVLRRRALAWGGADYGKAVKTGYGERDTGHGAVLTFEPWRSW